MTFQGSLFQDGEPFNGAAELTFSMPLSDESTWTETLSGVNVANGLYSVVLGNTEPIPIDLFLDASERTLTITVDGTTLGSVSIYPAFVPGVLDVDSVWANGIDIGTDEADNIVLRQDGSATFTGTVDVAELTINGAPLELGLPDNIDVDTLEAFALGIGTDDVDNATIDSEGNAVFNGDVTINGALTADNIQPTIPDGGLLILNNTAGDETVRLDGETGATIASELVSNGFWVQLRDRNAPSPNDDGDVIAALVQNFRDGGSSGENGAVMVWGKRDELGDEGISAVLAARGDTNDELHGYLELLNAGGSETTVELNGANGSVNSILNFTNFLQVQDLDDVPNFIAGTRDFDPNSSSDLGYMAVVGNVFDPAIDAYRFAAGINSFNDGTEQYSEFYQDITAADASYNRPMSKMGYDANAGTGFLEFYSNDDGAGNYPNNARMGIDGGGLGYLELKGNGGESFRIDANGLDISGSDLVTNVDLDVDQAAFGIRGEAGGTGADNFSSQYSGVLGVGSAEVGDNAGVRGIVNIAAGNANGGFSKGVQGTISSEEPSAVGYGVRGDLSGQYSFASAVRGIATNTQGNGDPFNSNNLGGLFSAGENPEINIGVVGNTFGDAGVASRNIGVSGESTSANSVENIGVFGTAENATGDNWAGFFLGDVKVTGDLSIDGSSNISASPDFSGETLTSNGLNVFGAFSRISLWNSSDNSYQVVEAFEENDYGIVDLRNNVGNVSISLQGGSGAGVFGDAFDNGVAINDGAPLLQMWSGGTGADDGNEAITLNADDGSGYFSGDLTVDGSIIGSINPSIEGVDIFNFDDGGDNFGGINLRAGDDTFANGSNIRSSLEINRSSTGKSVGVLRLRSDVLDGDNFPYTFVNLEVSDDNNGNNAAGISGNLVLEGSNDGSSVVPNIILGGDTFEDNSLGKLEIVGSTDGGGFTQSNIAMNIETRGGFQGGVLRMYRNQNGENNETVLLDANNQEIDGGGFLALRGADFSDKVRISASNNQGAIEAVASGGSANASLYSGWGTDGQGALVLRDANAEDRAFFTVDDDGAGSYWGGLSLRDASGADVIGLNGENGDASFSGNLAANSSEFGDAYDNGVVINDGLPLVSIFSGGTGADDGISTIELNGDNRTININAADNSYQPISLQDQANGGEIFVSNSAGHAWAHFQSEFQQIAFNNDADGNTFVSTDGVSGNNSSGNWSINNDGSASFSGDITSASSSVNVGDNRNIAIGASSGDSFAKPFLQMFGNDGNLEVDMRIFNGATGDYGYIGLRDENDNTSIDLSGDDGSANFTGNVTAANVTAPSDRRYKENIQTLDNTLDNVSKMRGVSYDWKEDKFGEQTEIGVIAQEVEKIYPEFVHTDKNGMKSVNYAQMTAVLIEAIKELNSEVQSLKTENAELKAEASKTAELSKRIETIEKLLELQVGSATSTAKN